MLRKLLLVAVAGCLTLPSSSQASCRERYDALLQRLESEINWDIIHRGAYGAVAGGIVATLSKAMDSKAQTIIKVCTLVGGLVGFANHCNELEELQKARNLFDEAEQRNGLLLDDIAAEYFLHFPREEYRVSPMTGPDQLQLLADDIAYVLAQRDLGNFYRYCPVDPLDAKDLSLRAIKKRFATYTQIIESIATTPLNMQVANPLRLKKSPCHPKATGAFNY